MDISEFKKRPGAHPFRRHPWEIARSMFITGLVRRAKQPPVKHIADIGCGDGYIIRMLLEKNTAALYSAFDHALTEDMLADLKETGSHFNGTDSQSPGTGSPDIFFFRSLEDPAVRELPKPDIVLILDVLEHTSYEGALLAGIKTSLRTDQSTSWIITVPAFQSLFSHHDNQLGHYRRYDLRQLTAVCDSNGLLIDKKGYFFLSPLIVRIFQKAGRKRTRSAGHDSQEQDTVQNWKGNRFLTRLFTLLLRADYKMGTLISKTGITVPGLSCYCICHQSP